MYTPMQLFVPAVCVLVCAHEVDCSVILLLFMYPQSCNKDSKVNTPLLSPYELRELLSARCC